MSKRSFERSVRKRLESGRIQFSSARHHGAAVILTNRIADISPEGLAQPHDEAFCDGCNSPVVLHPETLKQAPEAKILCAHCSGGSIPDDTIVRVNPNALVDMLFERWKLRKP